MQCKICRSSSTSIGELLILSKHRIQFFQCDGCGFVQTEDPFWLAEAYSQAIAMQDVGIMLRNEQDASITSALLKLCFPQVNRGLDFGGGHGIFVRMMRDRGFDFRWRDLYAPNDFARGFEYDPQSRYEFLTAFEVLEHFVDPMSEFERIMQLSPNIFVSTELLPDPLLSLNDWWYFSPSTGQHVSFYTQKTLQFIARQFNRHLLSNGHFHLFSSEPCNATLFRFAMHLRFAKLANTIKKRPSLIEADYKMLSGKQLR